MKPETGKCYRYSLCKQIVVVRCVNAEIGHWAVVYAESYPEWNGSWWPQLPRMEELVELSEEEALLYLGAM